MDNLLGYIVINICGLVFIYSGFRNFNRARKAQDTPTSVTSSAAQGTVELQGYPWPIELLKSPMSNLNSVYYEIQVSKGNGDSMVSCGEVIKVKPFYLVDHAGLAVIRTNIIEPELSANVKTWDELPYERRKEIREVMKVSQHSKNFHFDPSRSGPTVTVTEKHIPAGSPIYAYGFFKTDGRILSEQAPPHPGLDEFLTTVKKVNHLRGPALASIQVAQNLIQNSTTSRTELKVYGAMYFLEDERLYLADCWQDELLQRLGSGVKNYAIIVAGVAIVFLINFWLYFDMRSRR